MPDDAPVFVLRYTITDEGGRKWGFTINNVVSWEDGRIRNPWGRLLREIDLAVVEDFDYQEVKRRPVCSV